MPRTKLFPAGLSLVFFALCLGSAVPLFAQDAEAIANWTAPPYWTPAPPNPPENVEEARLVQPMALEVLPTGPLPFVAVMPCRVVDTRGAAGPFGGPALAANATRTFNVPSGPCAGIPSDAGAYSLNFTIIGGSGTFASAYLTAWATGDSQPVVSTLNFNANQLVANAAVVPAGTSGSINVFVNAPGHLLIDINGYYRAIPIVNTVNGQSGAVTVPTLPAGSSGQTLRYNGANWVASSALTNDGTNVGVPGSINFPNDVRVFHAGARFLATYSGNNLFLGDIAGNAPSINGTGNVGLGNAALRDISNGNSNTAVGTDAMEFALNSFNNTAVGFNADLNGGNGNTAVGYEALAADPEAFNTAIGYHALFQVTGSSANTAIGHQAGLNLISGRDNLYLGNSGVATESNTIRLGEGGGIHTRLFLAGVLGTSIGSASPMYINGVAQVGTVVSSARYKEDIRSMGDASERIFQLRPVTFRYRDHPDDATQFGLIAEEVEQILPELVLHDAAGRPETVMYHELPAMLVNELQKQQCEIAELKARLTKLEALLTASASK